MSTAQNIVLYGSGLFGRNVRATNAEQLAALKNSGFTTVILWSLHVDPNGDLAYNDTLIVHDGVFAYQFNYLADLIHDLKDGGTVDTVLVSIGAGGVTDFTNIQNLLATPQGKVTLIRSFNALTSALPIDGFDFDNEELGITVPTIANLTQILHGMGNLIITYCPYTTATIDWIGCLSTVYQQNGNTQLVKWFNLQCYAGGAGNLPQQWVAMIQSALQPTGVTNPAGFVLPGYWCQNGPDCNQGDCPVTMQRTFARLTTDDPGISGGFIWNSGDMFACQNATSCNGAPMTPTAYAQAMINGLNGIG